MASEDLSQLPESGVYALTLVFNNDEMISVGSLGRLPLIYFARSAIAPDVSLALTS